MLKFVIICLAGIHLSHALYGARDAVIELTDSNFDSKVTNSDAIWIVEFYSPGCGHCVNFAPAYKEAAKHLKGVINVGAVDASQHRSIGSRFSVRGFPTVKIFAGDKKNPSEFNGQRTSESLISEGLAAARKMINQRAGGGGGAGGSSSGGGDDSASSVVELTDSSFDKKVLNSDKMWFVGFFAPWCGHCQRLKPDFESAARALGGKVMFGSVDATVHQSAASKYNVRGYPTLYFFGPDKKNPTPYEGGRTAADIEAFLKEKYLSDMPPPKAKEITKPDQLDVCKEKQLCIIAALPDLLDCQSKCRKDYIAAIEKAGAKHKAKDWRYFWVSATVQSKLEDAFNLGGSGYPSLVAYNQKKKKYAQLRGSFSADGIHEFLRDVSLGSRSIALQDAKDSLPDIKKTASWDGKDAEMPDVHEIPLDEL